MGKRRDFNTLVRSTCIRIFWQIIFSVMLLYLFPLLTVSVEIIVVDQYVLAEGISSIFLNVFSWIYIFIVSTVIISLNLRKLLRLIKKEMNIVYHKSMWLSPGAEDSSVLTLEEFIETSNRIDIMQAKIKAMIQKEKDQKRELIFRVSSASHDLKSPLTVIQGNSELLLCTELEDRQRTFLEDIFTACQQMSTYFNILIGYSKTFYEDKDNWEEYSLEEVVERLKEESIFALEDKSVLNIVDKVGDDCQVRMNLDYLVRAVINLINNAWEYSNTANKEIELKIEVVNEELEISVWNKGSFFSQEMLNNYGKLFYRQNSARSDEGGHYGIGLAFVKRVANLHLGSLDIQNVDGGVLALMRIKLRS